MALAGKAAFFWFLYLEALDASFSFDGLIGVALIAASFWSSAHRNRAAAAGGRTPTRGPR